MFMSDVRLSRMIVNRISLSPDQLVNVRAIVGTVSEKFAFLTSAFRHCFADDYSSECVIKPEEARLIICVPQYPSELALGLPIQELAEIELV